MARRIISMISETGRWIIGRIYNNILLADQVRELFLLIFVEEMRAY